MRSPKDILGSSLMPRLKALLWGLWALSRAWVHSQPEAGTYVAEIEAWTPLPSEFAWIAAGVLLILGSAPPVARWQAFTCGVRACRVVGINLVATLIAVWLVGSVAYQAVGAATTNLLLVSLVLDSSYTIARERAVRGDLPNAQ